MVVGLLVGTSLAGLASYPGAGGGLPAPLLGTGGALSLSDPPTVSYSESGGPIALSSAFWGVDGNGELAVGSSLTPYLNATPADYVVWPSGDLGDRENVLTDVLWSSDGTNVTIFDTSEAQFASWCEQIGCHAILQVPGEIDNATFAAEVVNYTLNTLHFTPAYWEIGNEPAGWMHWKEPWTQWRASDNNTTTPMEYAEEVSAYIAAMQAIDPSLPIVGLPGVGTGVSNETTWLSATVSVNGPNLAAVAVHVYPAGSAPSNDVSLAEFNSHLVGKSTLATRIPADEAAVEAACPSCSIPILVTEFNSGTNSSTASYHGYETFLAGFANVPFIAAEVVQALNLSLRNLDYYVFQSNTFPGAWLSTTDATTPTYTLYSTLFARLGDYVQRIQPTGSVPAGFYAADTENAGGTVHTILIANANTSTAVTLSLDGLGLPIDAPATFWSWNNTSAAPAETAWRTGAPATVTVAAESVALIETPTYSVTFTESGLPAGTNWSVGLGDSSGNSTADTITFPAVNGTYAYRVGEVPGYSATPARGSVSVTGSNTGATIDWTPVTYSVNFSEEGLPTGTDWSVTFDGATNSSTSPSVGFSSVNGTFPYTVLGVDNFTASPDEGSVRVDGENATVAISWSSALYRISFVEDGLPALTSWSVGVNGTTRSSTAATIAFEEPNGSFVASVHGLPNYSANVSVLPFVVAGVAATYDIGWMRNLYLVTIEETGLPAGTNWSATINGTAVSSTTDRIASAEPNGTFEAPIGAVAGYWPTPATAKCVIDGAPVAVAISFGVTQYPVLFTEGGLPPGTNWSVTLNGTTLNATGAISFEEPNGTYRASVGGVTGYVANVSTLEVVVNDSGVSVPVTFSLPEEYVVEFLETGLGAGSVWGVTFNGTGEHSPTTAVVLHAANGTYPYQIERVDGYTSTPSSGTVVVDGSNAEVSVVFASSAGPSGATTTGLPVYADLAIVVVPAIVVGVILVGLRAARRRRDREPPLDP